jgi:hypothetical protein
MIKKLLPLAILIAIWIFASGQSITKSGVSRNSLELSHRSQDFITRPVNQLTQGQKIVGRFTAKENNLGQLAVRFTGNYKEPSDRIVFRFKPENHHQWYYQAEYNTDQFQNNQLFPFGFPLIEQSKGQSYIFEIESLSGSTESGQIGISKENPPFTSRYTFSPRSVIAISTFLIKKTFNILSNSDFLATSFIFIIPILFYLALIAHKKAYYLILFPLLVIFIDLLIFRKNINAVYWIAFLTATVGSYHTKIRPYLISRTGFAFLVAVPLFVIFDLNPFAEKLSIWFIVLLAVYSIQSIIHQLEQGKKYLNFKQLTQKILHSYLPTVKPSLSTIKFAHLTFPVITFAVEEVRITRLTPAIQNFAKIVSVLVSVNLIYSLISNTLSTIEVYQNYYPSDSFGHFIQQTGQYAVISLLIGMVIVLGLLFAFRNRQTIVFIITPTLLLSLFLITNHIYINTTWFQYDVRLWSVRPAKATLWDEIKLSGRNFRNMPFQGKVYIDNIEHTVVSWTDKQIVIQADPTKTSSGEIKVIDYYGKESVNTLPIEYYDFDTKELIE